MSDEKTTFTSEELKQIEANAEANFNRERRAAAQAAADDYFADKKRIGIATNIGGMHYDTAIEPAQMLKFHVDEAIRKVHEALAQEGLQPIEDITIQIRVGVIAEPIPKEA